MNAEQAISKFLSRFRSETIEENVYLPKVKVASTVTPSERPNFNEWAQHVKQQNDGKFVRNTQ